MAQKLIIIMALWTFISYSCSEASEDSQIAEGTLKDYYNYWDKINNEEIHLKELEQEYYNAFGTNDDAKINAALDKFKEAQKRGISRVMEKYPSGAIKFPFEQNVPVSLVELKSVYISGYSYPWATATRNSFYLTFEYNLKQPDVRFKTIRVEFYDTKDEIINACNIDLNKSGKTVIYIKPELEFKKFLKLKIVDSEN